MADDQPQAHADEPKLEFSVRVSTRRLVQLIPNDLEASPIDTIKAVSDYLGFIAQPVNDPSVNGYWDVTVEPVKSKPQGETNGKAEAGT